MAESSVPTPEQKTEMDSIRSYRRTLSLIKDDLRLAEITPGGVRVTNSRDSIGLGTPASPQIQAPIDLHLGRLEELLQVPARLIDEIQLACKETVGLTAVGP